MAAKAVIVADANGTPLVDAEVTLVIGDQHEIMPLTNTDGYSLSTLPWTEGSGYLKVVASGYYSYLQLVTVDDENQNIMVGADGGGDNAVHLPPVLKASGSSFPNYPTRDQVCDIFCGFQGIFVNTNQFGVIRAFGPEAGALSDIDTINYCEQMKAFGFTHVEFAISWQYNERDYQYPVPGMDLAYDLQEVCRRCDLIIRQGMFIKFSLAGDGMSVNEDPAPGEYNDPQGWTYGYQWAMINLERIIWCLEDYQGHDLTKFIAFVPGYDGVFYGWGPPNEKPDLQPTRVIEFGRHFRQIKPDGYLVLEHTTGDIPIGGGTRDWETNGPLDAYDSLLSEFDPFNLHSNSTWQIVARFTRPYNRPPDQPVGDDENPPFYLADCSRGRRFYIMYELLTNRWVRGGVSTEECNQEYDYFKEMAPNATLCMVRQ